MLKRKCLLIVLAVLIVLSLCACSQAETQNDSGANTTPNTQEQTTPDVEIDSDPLFTEINHYVIKADVLAYLSDELIEYYQQAMDAVFSRQSEIKLSDSYDDNLSIMSALRYNPYFFLVDEFDITSDHAGIYFTYAYSEEEQKEMVEFVDNEYLTFLNASITSDMNELEKVLAVYRYFGSRISYNYEWVDGLNMSDEKYVYPDIEIYEALKTNQGVCHSYTYLCEFALQQLGIECLPVSAQMTTSDESHMWLVVRIDGKYYHCDPTWDSRGDEVGLKYFGMTDEECHARGVANFENSYDMMYGEFSCDDTRFSSLRDVYNYQLNQDHSLTVYRDYEDEPETIDISTFA